MGDEKLSKTSTKDLGRIRLSEDWPASQETKGPSLEDYEITRRYAALALARLSDRKPSGI